MEIPHFGSMRGKERELIVLRSENGETWKEHQFDSKNEDLTELLNGMDEGNYGGSSFLCTYLQAKIKGMSKLQEAVLEFCTFVFQTGNQVPECLLLFSVLKA